ncbi:hypothetical protein DFS34DRAFT_641079 [Phlyctochytrium arcticum]|nr:hypothetical protein DFS34DRAFT_641079 [Phlyctochytrium arcticum]
MPPFCEEPLAAAPMNGQSATSNDNQERSSTSHLSLSLDRLKGGATSIATTPAFSGSSTTTTGPTTTTMTSASVSRDCVHPARSGHKHDDPKNSHKTIGKPLTTTDGDDDLLGDVLGIMQSHAQQRLQQQQDIKKKRSKEMKRQSCVSFTFHLPTSPPLPPASNPARTPGTPSTASTPPTPIGAATMAAAEKKSRRMSSTADYFGSSVSRSSPPVVPHPSTRRSSMVYGPTQGPMYLPLPVRQASAIDPASLHHHQQLARQGRRMSEHGAFAHVPRNAPILAASEADSDHDSEDTPLGLLIAPPQHQYSHSPTALSSRGGTPSSATLHEQYLVDDRERPRSSKKHQSQSRSRSRHSLAVNQPEISLNVPSTSSGSHSSKSKRHSRTHASMGHIDLPTGTPPKGNMFPSSSPSAAQDRLAYQQQQFYYQQQQEQQAVYQQQQQQAFYQQNQQQYGGQQRRTPRSGGQPPLSYRNSVADISIFQNGSHLASMQQPDPTRRRRPLSLVTGIPHQQFYYGQYTPPLTPDLYPPPPQSSSYAMSHLQVGQLPPPPPLLQFTHVDFRTSKTLRELAMTTHHVVTPPATPSASDTSSAHMAVPVPAAAAAAEKVVQGPSPAPSTSSSALEKSAPSIKAVSLSPDPTPSPPPPTSDQQSTTTKKQNRMSRLFFRNSSSKSETPETMPAATAESKPKEQQGRPRIPLPRPVSSFSLKSRRG